MRTYDIIVIGGGVIGVAVAYYLSKERTKIALIERDDLASGTSSRCDGNILLSGKNLGIDTEVMDISNKLFKSLSEEIDYDFEYTQRGSMYIIENENEWEIGEAYVNSQTKNGYLMQMLNHKDIHIEEPFLADDIIGGFLELNHSASINSMKYVYALSQHIIKNGVDVFPFCTVNDIKLNKNGAIESVVTNRGIFYTNNVVNCAGVWAPQIGKMIGINIPIIPRKGQLLVSEKTFPVGKRKILEFGYLAFKWSNIDHRRKIYSKLDQFGVAFVFEPTLSDNFIIGSSRSFEGYNTDVSIEVMQLIASRAIRFFPIMKDIHVIHAYAGLRPYVEDNSPIISAVSGIPGFYIAAGHEGCGIGLSPITGKLITQLILGEEPLIPLNKYNFSRFSN